MARGRKKGKAIKVLTSNDKNLMFGIARTGLASFYDARVRIGLSERRLKNLEKEGYIVSKDITIKGKKSIRTYYLNTKGKKYIKQNSNIDTFYRSNERQIEHDLKLSSMYYNLNKNERETWMNENDLINNYKDNHPNEKLNTMVDATYLSGNGYKIAVEVITRNYSKEEIEQKYEIAANIDCKEILKIEV